MAKQATSKPAPTTSEWVRRGRSKIHGGGLYAAKPIPAGTRVIEYVGERITKAEALRREERRLADRAKGKDGCVYVFELNKRHDIDGDVSWNTARLANHSCDGNCETDIIRGKVWLIAVRDIAAGEELTYDYGFDYADWKLHPCRCGAKQCVGYIVHRQHHWRVRKALKAEKVNKKSTAKKK
ncbi:MAG: SET domain-containing protein-lysine N-methyltransferase [Opitutaceae bacterium]|nr:SET domain-containing protein-lysine N-methyltransferase [Opitutaceae bacterium]